MPELTPSTREAARRVGITETALRKAEQSNRIAREPDGQWDIDKTRRRLVETADPVRSPLASGAGAEGTPFARLKVAQLALKVEAQRLSLDETKRRLLDVAEANAALDEIGSTMRDALLNWPARVAGHDMAVDPVAGRELIGLVPEEANVYADLSVWQNVMLMAELHAVERRLRTERGTELLGLFGLAERERQKGSDLSKGLRQRLMLCMALVGDPEILFLDEPPTGLDVASVHAIRRAVLQMNRDRGTTVFLTTHNIEEADELCHRVAIIHEGRIVAVDTPEALRGRMETWRSAEVCFATPGVRPAEVLDTTGREVVLLAEGFRVYGPDPGAMAQDIAVAAAARGIRIRSLNTRAQP